MTVAARGLAVIRRVWPWLAAACAVLCVAGAVAWVAVTARIEAGVTAAMQAAAEQGWTITSDPPGRAFNPWAPTVRLPHVVATRLVGGLDLRWTADQVDVAVSPLDPMAVHIDVSGAQSIALGPQAIPYGTRRARLRVPFAGDALQLTMDGFETRAGPTGLAVDTLTLELAPMSASLGADGVVASPPLPAPFQGPAALSARIVSTRPIILDAPDAATAWRAAGGRLDVPGFVLQWGPLHVDGEATGTLDAALQPEGRATLKVSGAPDVLDAATRAGLVAPSPAQAARAVLGLLTMAARGGPVTLPVTLKDRTVSVSQFPLARLPLLDWAGR